ncbi:S1 family peptidase [Streptomyces sp. NRRL WC-3742]|uniref:S1 family peptidase n=1 Tax=Streptomyces sp. NRRL WC-3742 TaxID=1463934 RepID=UPI0004C56FC7|nr:serine protease [Streptomyces sp. NRRL WC-3742]
MADRRLAFVRVRFANGVRKRASGYLVAPDLVLTAAHALTATGGPDLESVTVRFPHAGNDPVAAETLWQRRDEQVDAALLRTAGRPFLGASDLPPLRWGVFVTDRPGCPVTAIGFPRVDATESTYDTRQLSGVIDPGTGALTHRYEVRSAQPLPPQRFPAPGATPWSGMSGAVLFHQDQDLLLGVVRTDRRPAHGSLLTATPAQALLADDGFRALLEARAGAPLLPEPIEIAHLLAPLAPDHRPLSPAGLLNAEFEVVPLHGREPEQRELRDWCRPDGPDVSVRILAGTGGTGKTRLARWLVAHMRREGWTAGQLRQNALADDTGRALSRVEGPLLLVTDYAEAEASQIRGFVEAVLARRRQRPTIRLLLVARAAGAWRTDPLLSGSWADELVRGAPVRELQPIRDGLATRRAHYRQVLRALAPQLERLPGHPLPVDETSRPAHWQAVAEIVQPPEDLADDAYGVPFNLQLSALVALLRHAPLPSADTVRQFSPATLEDALLDHESRYWAQAARRNGIAVSRELLSLAVAVATLCGAPGRREAVDTFARLSVLPAHLHVELALLVRSLYPSPSEYWGRVQPDRLSEHLGARMVLDDEDLLPEILAVASPAQQKQALIDLMRAVLAHTLAGRTATARRLLDLLGGAVEEDRACLEALTALYLAMPPGIPVLTGFEITLSRKLVRYHRARAADAPEHRADLAWALKQQWACSLTPSRPSGDLAPLEEAELILRRLAVQDPEEYLPPLARCLTSLAHALRRSGTAEKAMEAARNAVHLNTSLMTWGTGPTEEVRAAHLGDLADAVHSLALAAHVSGDRATARRLLEEAGRHYTELMRQDGDRYRGDVAAVLMDLAEDYALAGYHRLALAAAHFAVRHHRDRARHDPLASEAFLADALDVLMERQLDSARCIDLARGWTARSHGRAEPASTAWVYRTNGSTPAQAAVLRRRIGEQYPEEYLIVRARSLAFLTRYELGLNHVEAAVRHAREGVRVWRLLADRAPKGGDTDLAYVPDLSVALQLLARVHLVTGDLPRAVAAARKAVSILRRLPGGRAALVRAELADALLTLSEIRRGAAPRGDRRVHGVRPAQEALRVAHRLHREPQILNRSLYDAAFAVNRGGT